VLVPARGSKWQNAVLYWLQPSTAAATRLQFQLSPSSFHLSMEHGVGNSSRSFFCGSYNLYSRGYFCLFFSFDLIYTILFSTRHLK
jgi:hypothetical protein